MSFLKKPLRKIRELGGSSKVNADDATPNKEEGISGTSTPNSLNGKGAANGNGENKRQSQDVERKRQSIDKLRTKAENKKKQSLAKIEDERFLREGPPSLTKLYKPYSMNMSKRWDQEKRLLFKELDWKSMFTPGNCRIKLMGPRNGWRGYYFPMSYTHSPSNECQTRFHCLPPTDYHYTRSVAEF